MSVITNKYSHLKINTIKENDHYFNGKRNKPILGLKIGQKNLKRKELEKPQVAEFSIPGGFPLFELRV